ncbi:GNAT family N-acetyltransferase [Halomicronema sp. CCY15110]|uniref:GNAT family N-acetyltransferase n=1 Tax=Halomicronema sp. CCY15110 TaxID=2767773 RepID=UPI00194F8158|nr:GNAT family N-acetyltransferase [Halomicronema sp. CCY15110]
MELQIKPLEINHGREILNWRYSYPYDIYNFQGDIEHGLANLLAPDNAFFAILNLQGVLEGYCSFGADGQVPGGDYRAAGLDIGMGIRPDLTGKGNGKFYAQAVVDYEIEHFQSEQLRVTIADFNQRAQRVWRKVGFEPAKAFYKTGTENKFVILCRILERQSSSYSK